MLSLGYLDCLAGIAVILVIDASVCLLLIWATVKIVKVLDKHL